MSDTESEMERVEQQDLLTAERDGDTIQLSVDGQASVGLSVDDYEALLTELKRTKWLTVDSEQLESEETVMKFGGKFVGKGDCHECGFEGYIVENNAGTTYCPKCRSTNVGWPVR